MQDVCRLGLVYISHSTHWASVNGCLSIDDTLELQMQLWGSRLLATSTKRAFRIACTVYLHDFFFRLYAMIAEEENMGGSILFSVWDAVGVPVGVPVGACVQNK